jgi:hypothetical protein
MDQSALRILNKLRTITSPSKPRFSDSTPEEARASAFAGPLHEYIRGLLTESQSIAVELFGRKGIEQLLDEHATRGHNHLVLLGQLVTIEHYRKMIERAMQDSKRPPIDPLP